MTTHSGAVSVTNVTDLPEPTIRWSLWGALCTRLARRPEPRRYGSVSLCRLPDCTIVVEGPALSPNETNIMCHRLGSLANGTTSSLVLPDGFRVRYVACGESLPATDADTPALEQALLDLLRLPANAAFSGSPSPASARLASARERGLGGEGL